MAAHPPHNGRGARDSAQDTPDSPRRHNQAVRSGAAAGYAAPHPSDLSSLSHSPAPRPDAEARASGEAPQADETPGKADWRRPRRRAPRPAERGAPTGPASQAGAGLHNKWPLTRRTASESAGTERRIRRTARNAPTCPCGRRAAAGYAAPDPAAPLPSLTHRRLDPAPRRDRAAKRRDTTRRRARLTRAEQDIERRGA